MDMVDLMDPATINEMIRLTPGSRRVAYGGVRGWGHDAHVPRGFGDADDGGVIASDPSVVVASGYFPGVCLDEGLGTAAGSGERVTVGDYDWYIRGMEPGEAPGEVRLLLSNRETNSG